MKNFTEYKKVINIWFQIHIATNISKLPLVQLWIKSKNTYFGQYQRINFNYLKRLLKHVSLPWILLFYFNNKRNPQMTRLNIETYENPVISHKQNIKQICKTLRQIPLYSGIFCFANYILLKCLFRLI